VTTPAFSPLEPPASLAESVADAIRERILSGTFAPGERLVEAEIARQLHISRGPVREALARLRAEGLAYEEPRRGSFVAALSPDDVREIYELRAALETRAARLLIERGDDAAFARLDAIVDGLRRAAEADDRTEFARLDAALHEQLCLESGNSRLHRTFVNHAGVLGTLVRLEVTTQYDELDGLLREHESLWAAVRSRDVERAERACNEHLAQAYQRVSAMRHHAADPR
jgi:DNA-binding GntR family transcriptional regulator